MNKCEKCGAKVGKKATFCPKCGVKIEREEGITPPKGYVSVKVFIVGVVIAAIIGFLAVFITMSMRKGENSKSTNEIVNNETKPDNKEDETTQAKDDEKEDETTQAKDDGKEDQTSQGEGTENKFGYVIKGFNYINLDREVALKEGDIAKQYPDIYNQINYDDELFEKIDSKSEMASSFTYSSVSFFKAQPRDIIEIDYRNENSTFIGVKGSKYSYDLLSQEFINDIPEDAYAVTNNCTVTVMKKEYLMTLEPGYYEFNFEFRMENEIRSTRMLVIIRDETVDSGYYRPNISNAAQFYSLEKKNDVMFYLNGTMEPIDLVLLNYKPVEAKYYEIICDGYGIVFSSEFFELYKDEPYLEMILRTKSGLKADMKVAYMN